MFEEAQIYTPIVRDGDDVTVQLADNHPGVLDSDYRARRNALAALALARHATARGGVHRSRARGVAHRLQ